MPPQHTLGCAEVPLFQDGELLYRRYLSFHFEDGELDPSAIQLDEPPSCVRSRFSVPEDALNPDCADGQDVLTFGVLQMAANAVGHREVTSDGRAFEFSPVHRPLDT